MGPVSDFLEGWFWFWYKHIYRVDFPQQPLGGTWIAGAGPPFSGCVSRCHEWWPDQPAVPVFRFVGRRTWVEAGTSERSFNLSTIGGGNSNILYFHPEPWGRWTQFDSYFWNGLKPPSSQRSQFYVENHSEMTNRDNCLYKLYLQIDIRIHSECML